MLLRCCVLIIAISALAAGTAAQSTADSPMSNAWNLGSNLSLAGILHSQSGDAALVGRQFALATTAATRLGIKLPALPPKSGDKTKDSAAVLNYLLKTTGDPIASLLTRSHTPEHAAIFEVALKSNLLLELYAPGDQTGKTIAGVIVARSERAKYLAGMARPLLQLIEQNASFEKVKNELFALHDTSPKYIAIIEFSRNGETAYAAKDYPRSAAEFTKAIAVDPSHAEFFFGRGRANLQMEKYPEAIADYTKVIQLEKPTVESAGNLAIAYHNRGLAYSLTTKYALAIADLTQAIKWNPRYATAYKTRGLVHQKMGNAKLAAADFQAAEKLQPGITR